MATINDLIKKSYRLLNVIAAGEDLESEQLDEGLEFCNRMIGTWNTNGLNSYYVVREDLTLVANQQSYTIGSSGDLNTTRPQEIFHATLTENGNTWPVEIMNTAQWMDIITKGDTSSIPYWIYYESNYPLGTIYIYPKPSAANTLNISSWKQIGDFSLGDSISLPDGYERAIIANLAKELWPMYPSESVFGVINDMAKSTLSALKRINSKNIIKEMTGDLDSGSNYNYLFNN